MDAREFIAKQAEDFFADGQGPDFWFGKHHSPKPTIANFVVFIFLTPAQFFGRCQSELQQLRIES